MHAHINRCTCMYASIKPSGCIAFPYLSGKVIQPPGVYKTEWLYSLSVSLWKGHTATRSFSSPHL